MNILIKPTKLIKYSLMVILMVTSLIIINQEKSQAQIDSYGAISYSPSEGVHGNSNNKSSANQAIREAEESCEENDCRTRWVKNGCVALAVNLNNKKKYSFGSDISLSSAENNAVENCPECTIIRYLCTSN